MEISAFAGIEIMKRVRIQTGKIGLVFKRGNYQGFLKAGVHWVGFRKSVIQYNLNQMFHTPVPLELLLEDEALVAQWHLIEVADNELILAFENGLFKQVLTAGRYVFWKGLITYTFTRVDIGKVYITESIDKAVLSHAILGSYVRLFEVMEYEKAVLLVDDAFVKILNPGVYRFWRNAISIKVAKVDMRQLQLEISGQELLTKDKASVRMNFYTQYKVHDVEKALLDNKDYEKQLYIVMQLALRAYVGNYTLDELLESKEALALAVLNESKTVAEKLGVRLHNCGVRDIILTGEMRDIMNRVLIAQKTAQANVITRREETASTRSLLNTAKLMEDNEMLYKLKEMEYVEKIADKVGEITLNGSQGMVTQLKELFTAGK